MIHRCNSYRLNSYLDIPMNAADYWEQHYASGNNSGSGSHGDLADFKADVINGLIEMMMIPSVIDFGSGDGNIASKIQCTNYQGYDVAPTAVQHCRTHLPQKSFDLIRDYDGRVACMSLSLDVIFHLLTKDDFETYMDRLFNAATQLVVIYSTNIDLPQLPQAPHVQHHRFTAWINNNRPFWRLVEFIPNRYPNDSNSDFYVYAPT